MPKSFRPLAALLLLGGCITVNTKGYPPVARTDVAPLVATADDTTWVLARPPFTVVGRYSQTLDLPGGLTGVARSWERMFGAPPSPVTVVLVEPPARKLERGERVEPPAIPDSLARRTVIWVPTARFDDGDRMRRMDGPPVAGTPVMMGGMGGTAGMQVAQAWLEQRAGGAAGAQSLAPWLRAGLVEAIAGSGRMANPWLRNRDLPTIPVDELVARQCPAGWAPVPRWRPAAPGDTAAAPPPPDSARREERRDRPRPRNPEEAFREDMRSKGCGMAFRLASASFVRFLLDRAGDATADALVKGALAGSSLEQSLAGAERLPRTTAELERAWRAWEQEQGDPRAR